MGMLTEFREFAAKGNVVDLAVGVIIGAAFAKIVDSLVGDIIMPVVGRIIGSLDFTNLFLILREPPPGIPHTLVDLKKAGVPVLAYGSFITVVVNFLLLAFIIFIMVRQINRLKNLQAREQAAAAPAAPAEPPEEVKLLREIRDALRR